MSVQLTVKCFFLLSFAGAAFAAGVPWCGALAGPGPCRTTIWTEIGGALDDINRANTAAAQQMGVRVEQARQRFWKSYPNGPDHEQAKAAFAQALAEKDIYFCKAEILLSKQNYSRDGSGTKLFREGANPDGGIRPLATGLFHKWSQNVDFQMKQVDSGSPFNFQERLAAALLPQGTEIMLKASVRGANVGISVGTVVYGGRRISVTTDEYYYRVPVDVQPPRSATRRRQVRISEPEPAQVPPNISFVLTVSAPATLDSGAQ